MEGEKRVGIKYQEDTEEKKAHWLRRLLKRDII